MQDTKSKSRRSELVPLSISISTPPSALASTASESIDGTILSRPSTPSLRLEEWLSKRSKHSRPPVHLRIPSPDFVYENKGLERNFNLSTSHTLHIQTPESYTTLLSQENSKKNDDLWEIFFKRFSKIPEEKDDEEDSTLKMVIDDNVILADTICYTDIPWIGSLDTTSSSSSSSQQILPLTREEIGLSHSIFFLDQEKGIERSIIKERFRILLLRWHSDKFLQLFQNLIDPKDEEEIKQRLNSTTSRLYEIRDELLGVSSSGKS